jgi:ribosomal protein S18 acetylase RimI-like enzyme
MAATPDLLGTRIRPADRRDLPAVVALRRAVGWGSGGLEGTFAAAAAGRLAILVAERDGAVVGAVTVAFHPGLPAGRAHVSDLLVSPDCRRCGIGTALLAAAEREAERRGLRECTLDVDAHNTAALALYRKSGYVYYRPAQFPWGPGQTLRKRLGPPPRSRPALRLLTRLRWRLR